MDLYLTRLTEAEFQRLLVEVQEGLLCGDIEDRSRVLDLYPDSLYLLSAMLTGDWSASGAPPWGLALMGGNPVGPRFEYEFYLTPAEVVQASQALARINERGFDIRFDAQYPPSDPAFYTQEKKESFRAGARAAFAELKAFYTSAAAGHEVVVKRLA